jgi:hypothetical protein
MPRKPNEYQRLPGRGPRVDGSLLTGFSRLWLAGDHLLLVERTGYTESYKRFYFRDIQAVMIRKTANAAMTSSILGIFALVFILWALAVDNLPGRVTLWIIGGIFAFFTLISLWRGPSCVVHIKTSVQTEQLPPWNRLRAARRGMERIRPRLLEAQGAYFPEELKAELEIRLGRFSENPSARMT